jgi:CRISPR/Cas system-associated exonuclease Cas4 (RecB family)
MERFFDEEIARGRKVYAVELAVEGEIGGVAFEGRIDRIDTGEEGYSLIDYKVSRTEIKAESEKTAADSHKYQLTLYAALLANKGMGVEAAYYYDVLRGVLVSERALETKLESLPVHIERFIAKPTFDGTKDKKNCRYCDYAVICGVHADVAEEEGGDDE